MFWKSCPGANIGSPAAFSWTGVGFPDGPKSGPYVGFGTTTGVGAGAGAAGGCAPPGFCFTQEEFGQRQTPSEH